MFDEVLTNFLTRDFWPDFLFVNEYPALAVIWNIFLATIPLAIYYLLVKISQKDINFTKKATVRLLFLVWLLFLPNSAYIITEIRHLSGLYDNINVYNREVVGVWSIVFFFLYALVGYGLFVYSVQRMVKLLKDSFFVCSWLVLPVIMFTCSLGVLVGLVGRWNSWELFLQPRVVFLEVAKYFLFWEYFKNLIICFVLYYIMYYGGIFMTQRIKHE